MHRLLFSGCGGAGTKASEKVQGMLVATLLTMKPGEEPTPYKWIAVLGKWAQRRSR